MKRTLILLLIGYIVIVLILSACNPERGLKTPLPNRDYSILPDSFPSKIIPDTADKKIVAPADIK